MLKWYDDPLGWIIFIFLHSLYRTKHVGQEGVVDTQVGHGSTPIVDWRRDRCNRWVWCDIVPDFMPQPSGIIGMCCTNDVIHLKHVHSRQYVHICAHIHTFSVMALSSGNFEVFPMSFLIPGTISKRQ